MKSDRGSGAGAITISKRITVHFRDRVDERNGLGEIGRKSKVGDIKKIEKRAWWWGERTETAGLSHE